MRLPLIVALVACALIVAAVFVSTLETPPPAPPPASNAVETRAVDDDVPTTTTPLSATPATTPATPTAATTPIPADTGRIEGVVVDRRGAPVPRFHVYVALGGDNDPIEHDGVDGSFSVDVKRPRVTVVVNAEGYREARQQADVAQGRTTALRFVLDASNALHGTVSDAATHKAIAGADVEIVPGLAHTTSDDNGRFEFLSLPEKRFTVRAHANGYASLDVGGLRGDRSRDEAIDIELNALTEGGSPEEFVGVGMRIGGSNNGKPPNRVESISPDAPAAAALKVGDIIVEIDGTNVETMSVFDTSQLMRGSEGSSVRVKVLRDGEAVTVDVDRQRITTPPPAPPKLPKLPKHKR